MRTHDFIDGTPLGLKPGDNVPLQDIIYLVYWCTDGTEQFGHQNHFNCMTLTGVLNALCRITSDEIPF